MIILELYYLQGNKENLFLAKNKIYYTGDDYYEGNDGRFGYG